MVLSCTCSLGLADARRREVGSTLLVGALGCNLVGHGRRRLLPSGVLGAQGRGPARLQRWRSCQTVRPQNRLSRRGYQRGLAGFGVDYFRFPSDA